MPDRTIGSMLDNNTRSYSDECQMQGGMPTSAYGTPEKDKAQDVSDKS
jgi:hypothetical protein